MVSEWSARAGVSWGDVGARAAPERLGRLVFSASQILPNRVADLLRDWPRLSRFAVAREPRASRSRCFWSFPRAGESPPKLVVTIASTSSPYRHLSAESCRDRRRGADAVAGAAITRPPHCRYHFLRRAIRASRRHRDARDLVHPGSADRLRFMAQDMVTLGRLTQLHTMKCRSAVIS